MDYNSEISDEDQISEDEDGAYLSMDERYYYKSRPRPIERRCSYCGIVKGRTGKIIMQCMYPQCGRKMCQECVITKHKRHKKHLVECTTGYIV